MKFYNVYYNYLGCVLKDISNTKENKNENNLF